jgi:hypothetical protein
MRQLSTVILLSLAALLPVCAQTTKRTAMPRRIPATTVISVRLIDTIDSEKAKEGQSFQASLEEPILVRGRELAPRGANASVRLIDLEKSGKFKGSTGLGVVLESITINSRAVPVETGTVTRTSSGKGKETALKTGIGAGIGAAIGAIAGGGKGAAIGAGVGGAAGAASQIFTKGKRVQIPSETILTFTTATETRL